jgi:hypothetical protein
MDETYGVKAKLYTSFEWGNVIGWTYGKVVAD